MLLVVVVVVRAAVCRTICSSSIPTGMKIAGRAQRLLEFYAKTGRAQRTRVPQTFECGGERNPGRRVCKKIVIKWYRPCYCNDRQCSGDPGENRWPGKRKSNPRNDRLVGVRLPPALRDSMMAEAKRKRIRLAEEIRHRLAQYDELIADKNQVDDAILGASLNSDLDDMIDKLAERIAAAMKDRKSEVWRMCDVAKSR